jgi:CRISPR-associated exonuclease Cas4
MGITGKHINYYHICHRKLWLFHNGISFQQTHDNVADGMLLHQTYGVVISNQTKWN